MHYVYGSGNTQMLSCGAEGTIPLLGCTRELGPDSRNQGIGPGSTEPSEFAFDGCLSSAAGGRVYGPDIQNLMHFLFVL